ALGRRAGRWMTMAGGGGLNRSSSRGQLPPQELLDDLCSRFLLNVPKEELESFERILFLLEQAHWFYEDNSVEHNPNLKSLSFKDFTSLMFKSCTALRPYIAHLDDIYKDFNNYKFRVPVSGAIILDDTYERDGRLGPAGAVLVERGIKMRKTTHVLLEKLYGVGCLCLFCLPTISTVQYALESLSRPMRALSPPTHRPAPPALEECHVLKLRQHPGKRLVYWNCRDYSVGVILPLLSTN
ncbi:hypothetical protein ACJX0J_041689, partial [Zea mays]